ncbi:MAG: hypothetical protein HXS46_14680 [Theionarchaea archaeon]|nr:MAG: hypothetical protein AYK18_11805 [Theionarchaea archaeon DG-70]MBU7011927.1 hypothetical protein [Theionarchaea archaeon]
MVQDIRESFLIHEITEKQYDELEELVERGEYTSIDEFIKELLREKFDDFTFYLHKILKKIGKSIFLLKYTANQED